MSFFETVTATQAYRDRCEDRVSVFHEDQRCVIVVADGAGGIGSGDLAAESVLREIKAEYVDIESADEWAACLRQLDARIGAGESTCVVVDVRPQGVLGASVGDSQAWIIHEGTLFDLTRHQHRKPLLGSGNAVPVAFEYAQLQGVLLVSTDGFSNYAKRESVIPLVSQVDFYSIPRQCVELVRLPSGDLWDDIGIVAARNKPRFRTRQRYEI